MTGPVWLTSLGDDAVELGIRLEGADIAAAAVHLDRLQAANLCADLGDWLAHGGQTVVYRCADDGTVTPA